MVFPWSLSDCKFPQISRNLLSILVDPSNNVVWIISTCPLISKPSSLFTSPLVTVPRVPIIVGITVNFMFHSFSIPLQGSGTYPSFRFPSTYFVVSRDSKFYKSARSLFLLLLLLDSVVLPRLGDPFLCQNPRGVCAFHSPGQILGCVYTMCWYGQISISCTVPRGSPYPPSGA